MVGTGLDERRMEGRKECGRGLSIIIRMLSLRNGCEVCKAAVTSVFGAVKNGRRTG